MKKFLAYAICRAAACSPARPAAGGDTAASIPARSPEAPEGSAFAAFAAGPATDKRGDSLPRKTLAGIKMDVVPTGLHPCRTALYRQPVQPLNTGRYVGYSHGTVFRTLSAIGRPTDLKGPKLRRAIRRDTGETMPNTR